MSTNEPFLVRFGVRYLRARSQGSAAAPGDAVHFLNPEERKALKKTERGAILRAAAAGAISTVIAAAVEVVVTKPLLGPRPQHATWEAEVRFYAVVGAATVVTSIVEILYLYWDGLRSVHRLSCDAGVDLFPEQDEARAVAAAMARAALELPNPTAPLFGVNPHREASRLRLVVASLVYKLKVSVTNFVAKALVRRALGRAFVRSWLPFVAVPLTAAWNALICSLIMREARIRAMGPSAASEMLDLAFEGSSPSRWSRALRASALRAVASAIVRTADVHPNLAAVFAEVAKRVDESAMLANEAAIDDTAAFLASLETLDTRERAIVLRVLAIASIIDGRLTRAERRLNLEARARCNLPPDLEAVEALRRAFLAGDPIAPDRIRSLSRPLEATGVLR